MPKQTGRGALKIAAVQMSCSDDPDANLANAIERVGAAASRGARLVCLPELFRSRYFCQTEDTRFFELAEPIPGPTTEELGRTAARTGVVLVGSVFEKRAPGVHHNTAVVIDRDGRLIGRYRKMHIPDDPLYYEKFYFTPGDLGFQSFATEPANVGVLVCWDQWFPEAARLTAMAGADVLVYPTAIGWHASEKAEFGAAQHSAWETMQRSHAIANGVFVAVPNRVGIEGTVEFWGGSFVCDPFGRVLARASHDQQEVLVVDCDRSLIDSARQNWPFFRDRRIDAYGDLLKRFRDENQPC